MKTKKAGLGLTKLEAEALGYEVALLDTAINGLTRDTHEEPVFVGIGELTHAIRKTLDIASGRVRS